jgi:hypothetical protein
MQFNQMCCCSERNRTSITELNPYGGGASVAVPIGNRSKGPKLNFDFEALAILKCFD